MSSTSRKYFQIDVHLLLLLQTYFHIICGPLYLRTIVNVVLMNKYAMETNAMCYMDNIYQCYVLTNYISYIKYTSMCRLRYKLVDSKSDNKTNDDI